MSEFNQPSKGWVTMKYWTHSITLVEGCSPVSEGCEYCWSAGYYHRFRAQKVYDFISESDLTINDTPDGNPRFNGIIRIREDRLPELLKGKDKVIQIWNDLFWSNL